MPTYVYRCKSCGFEMEEVQKFADDPLVECPSCKVKALVRVIGGAGLVFKGSGFYLTDYKNKSTSDSAASPAKDKTEGAPSTTPAPAPSSASPAKGDDRPAKPKKE